MDITVSSGQKYVKSTRRDFFLVFALIIAHLGSTDYVFFFNNNIALLFITTIYNNKSSF